MLTWCRTFQERSVSRRCLVFNNDTDSWECGKGVWTELLGVPQMFFEDPKNLNGDFADRHWRMERQVWPSAMQYTDVCAGFSKRKLTYANNALKAFSHHTEFHSLIPWWLLLRLARIHF